MIHQKVEVNQKNLVIVKMVVMKVKKDHQVQMKKVIV